MDAFRVNAAAPDSPFLFPWQPRAFGRSLRLTVPGAAAAVASLLTLFLYLGTMAPSVTLGDSGEYITAAATLGVPHPPGYPLWTLIGHLFAVLVPFGNVAWRVTLVSVAFGAATNGLAAWLVADSARWLLGDKDAGLPPWLLPFLGAVTAGLCLGCSEVMWSQSVIVEVYTLNAFFALGVVALFYHWLRAPERTGRLLASVVFFALGLTNHHDLAFLLLALLPGIALVRRNFFPTACAAALLLGISALGVLVSFSSDLRLLAFTQRFAFVVLAMVLGIALGATPWTAWRARWREGLQWAGGGLLVAWLAHRCLGGWFQIETGNGRALAALVVAVAAAIGLSSLDRRFIVKLLVLCWVCLSLYGLERAFSATNPPMNWSYTRSREGFFESVTRGQYASNSLSTLFLSHLGPWVGVAGGAPVAAAPTPPPPPGAGGPFAPVLSYVTGLQENFSLPLCLIAFLGLFLFGRLEGRRLRWLLFLLGSFLILSFLLSVIDPAKSWDHETWALRRRFFLPAHALFAVAIGYGVAGGLLALRRYSPALPLAALGAAPLLAVLPLALNYGTSTQCGHWFGWQYGADILRPLDKNAVFLGGSDPGRFVPTYMIFCESRQPARWKRDPSFDRSDLYVLTQNAMADDLYLDYVGDQYDAAKRQTVFTRLERWLGRDRAYPAAGLSLPTKEEVGKVFNAFYEGHRSGLPTTRDIFALNGEVTQILFEKNKAAHTFYVEESMPIPWMYPHMVPDGLVFKLSPDPLPALPPEAIARDRAFWDAYAARLLAEPGFLADEEARNSFARLRSSVGNLYAYRDLNDEAIYAYRQALEISPTYATSAECLAALYLKLGRTDEGKAFLNEAIARDPASAPLHDLLRLMEEKATSGAREKADREAMAAKPGDPAAYRDLANVLLERRDWTGLAAHLSELTRRFELGNDETTVYLRAVTLAQQLDAARAIVKSQLAFKPDDAVLTYQLASVEARDGKPDAAFPLLERALFLGPAQGYDFRVALPADKAWDPYRTDPRFMKLVRPSANAPAVPAKK